MGVRLVLRRFVMIRVVVFGGVGRGGGYDVLWVRRDVLRRKFTQCYTHFALENYLS